MEMACLECAYAFSLTSTRARACGFLKDFGVEMKIPVRVYMAGWEVHSAKHSTHISWAASMYEALWGHYSQVRVSALKASVDKRI